MGEVIRARPRSRVDVVVVGAGLAGLTAASELTRHGLRCAVLEAGERPGGRIRTVVFPDGATAEAGMEEIWESSPARELVEKLGLAVVEHPAQSNVIIDGRLVRYSAESGASNFFRHVVGDAGQAAFAHWSDTAQRLASMLELARLTGRSSPSLDRLARASLRSFVCGHDLTPGARRWIQLVAETETAVSWDAVAALDGIDELRPFLPTPARPDGERNVRLAGGNDALTHALAAALPDGAIRCGAFVRRVEDLGVRGGVEVRYADRDGLVRTVRAEHAVVTVPFWSLRTIGVEPALDTPSRRAIATMRAASYVKVVLRLRPDRVRLCETGEEPPFPLLSGGPAGCVYFTDGRHSGRDHVVTMLVHGARARRLSTRPESDVVRAGIDALEHLTASTAGGRPTPLVAGVRDAVTAGRAFVHPCAVACWPVQRNRSRFDRLAAALRAPHGRILIGGDSTDSTHSDGAVRAAQRMTDVIVARTAGTTGEPRSVRYRFGT